MSILLSVLALLATFYQLYLQRVHNEKSLKPLGQIVLEDRQQVMAVHLRNNGLGPLLIDRITYSKNGTACNSLDECLDLQPGSYMGTPTDDALTRVVLPNSSLTIFEVRLEEHEGELAFNAIRNQLSPISLEVVFHDIYDHRMTIARDLQWFTRHMSERDQMGL